MNTFEIVRLVMTGAISVVAGIIVGNILVVVLRAIVDFIKTTVNNVCVSIRSRKYYKESLSREVVPREESPCEKCFRERREEFYRRLGEKDSNTDCIDIADDLGLDIVTFGTIDGPRVAVLGCKSRC